MANGATLSSNAPSKMKEKRKWIFAKKPSGPLLIYRQWVGYGLLLFLMAAPFVKINGEAFLLFNVIERKFVIFGQVFWPQDLHIFVFGMLIAMVCIVLFTAVYGRVWCGWTCPQTVFMELVFRRIEYWIEGDWKQQQKLANQPKTSMWYLKKIAKHAVFLGVSFLIANIFLSYVIGVEQLWRIINDPLDAHLLGLISIVIFTLLFYGVFAFVREIVCTTICPYGRLQGVLMDDKTTTVAYDYGRGEPRGAKKKGQDSNVRGDCVDCNLCVQVCPTGIDIRNGTQLECVSCTACIDACDTVMDKINRPKKLIGFYSLAELADQSAPAKGNGRAIAYTVILCLLMGVFFWLLFSRSQVDGTLLRARGSTYQLHDDGTVTNLYSLELLNKSGEAVPFVLETSDGHYQVQYVTPLRTLGKDEAVQMTFFLKAKQREIKTYKSNLRIHVVSDGKVVERLKTTFVAPPGG